MAAGAGGRTCRSCGLSVPEYWNVIFLHLMTGFSRDLRSQRFFGSNTFKCNAAAFPARHAARDLQLGKAAWQEQAYRCLSFCKAAA